MFKALTLAGAALVMGTAVAPAAQAQGYYGDRHYSDRYYGDRYERGYDARYYDGYRDDRRYYRQNYRRCDAGTGGTVIGAIAGGLLGNSVAGRGDRAIGTILGAVGGGLAGRAIDRADNPEYCR